MHTSAVTAQPPRRPRGAPAAATESPVRARPTGGRLPARERRISLLCLAIVLADQASKAMQPAGTFVVNSGGPALLPSALSDALWQSQTFGAACDSIDALVLITALGAVRRVADTGRRVAVTAVLAGLLSNLLDRLGASSLFHAGLPRGSIDWISVPAWPSAKTNVADIVIALGILALAHQAGSRAARAVAVLVRPLPARRLSAALVGVIALATWTAIWQANRHTAELVPVSRIETPSQCEAYSSDGMDWVSYRPTGGPLAHHVLPCPNDPISRDARGRRGIPGPYRAIAASGRPIGTAWAAAGARMLHEVVAAEPAGDPVADRARLRSVRAGLGGRRAESPDVRPRDSGGWRRDDISRASRLR